MMHVLSCVHMHVQTEEAVELYMYAGGPRPALHLLNHQLSDLLEPALDDRVAGERRVVSQPDPWHRPTSFQSGSPHQAMAHCSVVVPQSGATPACRAHVSTSRPEARLPHP